LKPKYSQATTTTKLNSNLFVNKS